MCPPWSRPSESEARYAETQKQIAQLVNSFHQLQQVLMQQQQKPPSPPHQKKLHLRLCPTSLNQTTETSFTQ